MAGSKRKATPAPDDAARELAEATSALRKKTKDSEFVSVEAGMRALKRRSTRDSKGSKDAHEEAAAAAEVKPRVAAKRLATSTTTAQTKTAAKMVQSKLVLDAAPRPKRSTAKPPAAAELDHGSKPKATAASRTRSPAVKPSAVAAATEATEDVPTKAPAKRAPRTTAARGKPQAVIPESDVIKPIRKPRAPRKSSTPTKPSLAQVRAEMMREQQDRVESRIQTLQRPSQAIPASLPPSVAVGINMAPAPLATFHSAQEHTQSVVHYDPPAVHVPTAPSPPVHVAYVSNTSHVRETIARTLPPGNNAVHVTDQAASERQFSPLRESMPALHTPTDNVSVPEPEVTANEFIDDDFDEDMAFLQALEEVENKLATPSKSAPPANIIDVSQDPIGVQPKHAPIQSTAVQPDQKQVQPQPYVEPSRPSPTNQNSSRGPIEIDGHHPAYVDQHGAHYPNNAEVGDITAMRTTNYSTNSHLIVQPNAVVPEVLREMERLKRENDELRRSNELWQAVALHRSATGTPVNGDALTSDPDRNSLHVEERDSGDQPVARVLDLNSSPRSLEDRVSDTMTQASNSSPFGTADPDHNEYDGYQSSEAEISQEPASVQTPLSSEKPVHENQARSSPIKSRPTDDVEGIKPSFPAESVVDDSVEYKQHPVEGTRDAELFTTQDTAVEENQDVEFAEPSQGDASDNGESKDDPMSDSESEEIDATRETKDNSMDESESESIGTTDHNPTGTGYTVDIVRSSTIDRGTDKRYKRSYDDDEDEDIEDVSHQDAHKEVRNHAIANRKSRQERVVESRTLADKSAKRVGSLKPLLVSTVQQKPNVVYQVDSESESDDVTIIETGQMEPAELIPPKSSIALRLQVSDSSSESESEEEEEESSQTEKRSSSNVLEAALKAASGSILPAKPDSSAKSCKRVAVPKQPPPRDTRKQTVESIGKKRPRVETSTVELAPPLPVSVAVKKTVQAKKSTLAKSKSSVLWPVLDDFYDLILDLSPRNIRISEDRQQSLKRYQRKTLPGKYATKTEYMSVQLEAIMEEMVAGLRNSDEMRGNSNVKSLFLTSVSPCGSAAAFPSSKSRLNTSAIFMESAFSGTTSNSNDFMLTFHSNMMGKSGSSAEFINGDVVELSSPHWKEHRVHVFGIVLCNSVVAVGSGSDNPNDSDQICLLIRTPDEAHESFALLTEMCLANQRSSSWRWRLEQVHNMTTSAREFQAVKSVVFFGAEVAKTLLDGKLAQDAEVGGPSRGQAVLTPALQKDLQKRYNESQMEAIMGSIGNQKQVIIQGPPGTGKSKTILGILSALLDGAALNGTKKTSIKVGASLQHDQSARSKSVAESSIRILVAAPSNAAVDELIVRLLKEGVYDGRQKTTLRPRIVRVGRPESIQQQHQSRAANDRASSESKKLRKKWRKYAKDVDSILLETLVTKHKSSFATVKMARQAILKNAQIVFCTLSGAGSVAMCEFAQQFDALVIDEAAQAVEASTLIPFKFKPSRIVLVGDHRQLPATVMSKKLVGIGYDRSLFQRLVESGSPVFLLTQQYRMHPSISRFPSTYFYDGRLVNDARMKERTKRKYHKDRCFKPFVFFDVLGGEQSQVNGSKSLRNMTEVEFIVLLVRSLLARYPSMDWQDKIGIIAPYKQQIYELGAELRRLEAQLNLRLAIEVNTVDGFQGREKEIIIYSCVRTRSSHQRNRRNGGASEAAAFWADERRMNVAITRAQSSLWVIGNSQLLEQSPAWRTLLEDARARNLYIAQPDFQPPPPAAAE